jgi:glycerol-3-phosphate dehydrogenase (NAD(P)+)
MSDSYAVAVLGGGSFGTVIGNIVAGNGNHVQLWLRNAGRARTINESHENTDYLPGYSLDHKLRATTDLQEAVSAVDIIFVAVPSQSFREVVL